MPIREITHALCGYLHAIDFTPEQLYELCSAAKDSHCGYPSGIQILGAFIVDGLGDDPVTLFLAPTLPLEAPAAVLERLRTINLDVDCWHVDEFVKVLDEQYGPEVDVVYANAAAMAPDFRACYLSIHIPGFTPLGARDED